MGSEVPSVVNFRDVGQTVNRELGETSLSVGKLFRSARPDNATPEDRKKLQDIYGIKTIIDLRTATEHDEQAKKLRATGAREEDAHVPGASRILINFNGSSYSRHLISQLTWTQFFRLVGLMAVGRRLEAISILGTNVMQPRGLTGLGIDSVDVCRKEIKEVFDVLEDEKKYPVLVHCTQGKDRTGLVVELVLLLAGIPVDVITTDYMLTQGLNDDFANCAPGLVKAVADHIDEKYGGIDAYLETCGVSKESQEAVKRSMKWKEP